MIICNLNMKNQNDLCKTSELMNKLLNNQVNINIYIRFEQEYKYPGILYSNQPIKQDLPVWTFDTEPRIIREHYKNLGTPEIIQDMLFDFDNTGKKMKPIWLQKQVNSKKLKTKKLKTKNLK